MSCLRETRSLSLALWGPVLSLVVLLSLACGGGGGGGGGGTPSPPTPPAANLTFTPGSPGGQQSLSLVRTNVGVTELVLELRANAVDGLYGISTDITFPSTLLRFDSATEGSWLGGDGESTSFLATESSPGTLVIGLTRLGDTTGRDGTGDLIILRFTAAGSGNGSFQFSSNEYFDASGNTVPGVTWSGGSVRVQL